MNGVQSKLLKIDSDNADRYYNDLGTAFFCRFDPIDTINNQNILYSLKNIMIPYSFYGVNSNNNILVIHETVGNAVYDRTLTIPYGNYSAHQYQTKVLSLLNSVNYIIYTMAYQAIQNKYLLGITTPNSNTNFMLANGPSPFKQLGFDQINFNLTSVVNLLSTNCIVMSDIFYLQLKTNLGASLTATDNGDNILTIINIPTSTYSFILYEPPVQIKYLSSLKSLSNIHIELVDNYHRPVDLNNVPFHILFQIDIIENDDRPMGRRPVEQEQMHENDMTRLQQIAMNPKIIDVPTPMSMNDFIEFY